MITLRLTQKQCKELRAAFRENGVVISTDLGEQLCPGLTVERLVESADGRHQRKAWLHIDPVALRDSQTSSPSLNDVLRHLGYTKRRATDLRYDILSADGTVCFCGTADEVWTWLRVSHQWPNAAQAASAVADRGAAS